MNRVDPSYLPRSADKFSFDGPRRVQRITDYFVLVVLATVIATFGVTSNSDAMVIGAMIISPLMTPIMGATFNIVTGRPQHVWRSLVLAVVSIVVVVSLSMLLAKLVPNYQLSFANNAQITSRTSHNLIALLIALAACAAGGYSTAHKEIADSLPGVAIAISLVPLLSVVGIALTRGQWGDARCRRSVSQWCPTAHRESHLYCQRTVRWRPVRFRHVPRWC